MRVLLDTLPPGTDIAQRRAVAHGPHHWSGDTGRPEMGWIDAAMRARTVSRPLLIARPFRLCPRGQHSMRIRTVLCATALATVAAFPLAGVASAQQPTDRDCRDFASQAAAQSALRSHSGDPERLDSDHNGIACEEYFGPAPAADGPDDEPGGAARTARRRPRPEAGRRRPAARGARACARADGPRAPGPREAARRSPTPVTGRPPTSAGLGPGRPAGRRARRGRRGRSPGCPPAGRPALTGA